VTTPSKEQLLTWCLDVLRRSSGRALLADLYDRCCAEASATAGHRVSLHLTDVQVALETGPVRVRDNDVTLEPEGYPANEVRFVRSLVTQDVLWAWLAHEHRYKQTLGSIATRLSLTATARPESVTLPAILMVVDSELTGDPAYVEAVRLTVHDWSGYRWWEAEADASFAARVPVQLPNTDPKDVGGAEDRLTGWRQHLANPQHAREAADHALLLEKLENGAYIEPIIVAKSPHGYVLKDGKHRLLAQVDHMLKTGRRPARRVLLGS
jgi:hypothetical protein